MRGGEGSHLSSRITYELCSSSLTARKKNQGQVSVATVRSIEKSRDRHAGKQHCPQMILVPTDVLTVCICVFFYLDERRSVLKEWERGEGRRGKGGNLPLSFSNVLQQY